MLQKLIEAISVTSSWTWHEWVALACWIVIVPSVLGMWICFAAMFIIVAKGIGK
jgi:hypothetical protein